MDTAHAGFAFRDLTGIATHLRVVDCGTNPIDDAPPYAGMVRAGQAELVAFAPNPVTLARLRASAGHGETYLPCRLGDGRTRTLHFCESSDMTSLLEPDTRVFGLFHDAPEQARVAGTSQVTTTRLDDIGEASGAVLLKLSLQGAELMALRHASRLLRSVLVVHAAVAFVPLYKRQPLFCDIAAFLRHRGFLLHRFAARAAQGSQVVSAEAIFLRDITRLDLLTAAQLVGMAALLHDCYGSMDLAERLLGERDARCGGRLSADYAAALRGAPRVAA